MLVLSRKADDSIVIGSDIEITVLSVSSQRVKLGIRAPGHVRIVRSELLADHDASWSPVSTLLDGLAGEPAMTPTVPAVPR